MNYETKTPAGATAGAIKDFSLRSKATTLPAVIAQNTAAAECYIRQGWRVTPFQDGFNTATLNASQVRGYGDDWGKGVYGVPPYGTLIVHVDPRCGGCLEQLVKICGGRIPRTLIAQSGDYGISCYVFFRCDPGVKPNLHPVTQLGEVFPGLNLYKGGECLLPLPPTMFPETLVSGSWDTGKSNTVETPDNLVSFIAQAPGSLVDAVEGFSRLMGRYVCQDDRVAPFDAANARLIEATRGTPAARIQIDRAVRDAVARYRAGKHVNLRPEQGAALSCGFPPDYLPSLYREGVAL
ncbi:bifunctional DNA primase/polymerase [Mobiluncus curtisii]|uniref:bifunctional DNA primase/polymerase n=1 Tax=Mobiluncus curtisii TaxID=2051 RepID=UPI003C6CF994